MAVGASFGGFPRGGTGSTGAQIPGPHPRPAAQVPISVSTYYGPEFSGKYSFKKVQLIALIPDSVIPEFAHTGSRISVPQKHLTVCFVRSLVFGYTGFFIYRTLNLSPNPSPV